MNESKTQWTFAHELYDHNGVVSSRVIAEHDDFTLWDVMQRFKEFMRGCGYAGDELDDDNFEIEKILDDAMALLSKNCIHDNADTHDEYLRLMERYEKVAT